MALNFRTFLAGLRIFPKTPLTSDLMGELEVLSSDGRLYYNDGSTTSPLTSVTSTDTLSNKSFTDNSTFIVDNADPTKRIAFNATGTTGTTTTIISTQTANRVLTLPDATDTLVGKATTDILTNKSIDGSTNTITNLSLTTSVTGTLPVGSGGTGLATLTAHDVLVGNGTGNVTLISPSTSGFILTSNGTGADPTFQTNPGTGAITSLTGDVTATGPGAAAATLATVNGNVGSFGSSTSIPNFTVNAKGLITAAGGNAVIAPAGTLSGTTLNATVVSSSLTSVGTITSGTWNGTTIDVSHGGTGLATLTAHDVLVGNSTGNVTLISPSTAGFVLTSNGTGADPTFQASAGTSTAPTVQKFTSGSGTYTKPTSPAPLYIRVRMAGGGGGGSGGGLNASAGNGADGTDSTFGSSLLVAGKGSGAVFQANTATAGGTASLGSGPVGLALAGGQGTCGGQTTINTVSFAGAPGGNSAFGGGGGGSSFSATAGAGATNTGGGGGGGSNAAVSGNSGNGGGAGGFIDALIYTPSSTYSYSIGTGGTGGTAGTTGNAGGDGGSGIIIVEEFYQ